MGERTRTHATSHYTGCCLLPGVAAARMPYAARACDKTAAAHASGTERFEAEAQHADGEDGLHTGVVDPLPAKQPASVSLASLSPAAPCMTGRQAGRQAGRLRWRQKHARDLRRSDAKSRPPRRPHQQHSPDCQHRNFTQGGASGRGHGTRRARRTRRGR